MTANATTKFPTCPGRRPPPNHGQLESSLRTRAQLEKEGFLPMGTPDFLRLTGTPDIFLVSQTPAMAPARWCAPSSTPS